MQSNSENYLKLNLSYNPLPEGVKVNSTSMFLNGEITYKIFIENTTGQEVSLEDLGLKIDFEEKTSLLQYDETNDYYYIEMGTVMRDTYNEYIRWRFLSQDLNQKLGPADTINLSDLTGVYILETDVYSQYAKEAFELGIEKAREAIDNGDYLITFDELVSLISGVVDPESFLTQHFL